MFLQENGIVDQYFMLGEP
jgi:hypothetical protein